MGIFVEWVHGLFLKMGICVEWVHGLFLKIGTFVEWVYGLFLKIGIGNYQNINLNQKLGVKLEFEK